MGNSIIRNFSMARNINIAMQPKEMVLQMKSNVLTVASPQKSCEAEFELWNTIKSSIITLATTHQNKFAIAISPADEIVNISNDGEACIQCAAPYSDCYLLSPKTWSRAALQDLGSGMSFELGQLWFFTPPKNSDVNVTSLVKEVLELCSRDDFPNTTSELVGCVADDSLMLWTNCPTSHEMQEELKKVLDDAITATGLSWSVKML